jgi:hypothetical protein
MFSFNRKAPHDLSEMPKFVVAQPPLTTLDGELSNALCRILADDVQAGRVAEKSPQRSDCMASNPEPPVDAPARPARRPRADLPAAMSACIPSMSRSVRPLTSRAPSSAAPTRPIEQVEQILLHSRRPASRAREGSEYRS